MSEEESSKHFQALLNGIAKIDYYHEEDVTEDVLQERVYPHMDKDTFKALISKARFVLKNIVTSDMDSKQLQAFLTSQKSKKDGGITETQADAFARFWKLHQNKIHQTMVQQTQWTNKLKGMTWRTDVTMKSKNSEQINLPSAIVQLELENSLNPNKVEKIQFEVDEAKLSKIRTNLQDVEKSIADFQLS